MYGPIAEAGFNTLHLDLLQGNRQCARIQQVCQVLRFRQIGEPAADHCLAIQDGFIDDRCGNHGIIEHDAVQLPCVLACKLGECLGAVFIKRLRDTRDRSLSCQLGRRFGQNVGPVKDHRAAR